MSTRIGSFTASLKKAIAFVCITSILSANSMTMTVLAGPFDNIGGWISERANDVSEIAGEAGKAITDSDVGKAISEKATAAGEAIGEKASAAGEAIGNGMSTAGEFIGCELPVNFTPK